MSYTTIEERPIRWRRNPWRDGLFTGFLGGAAVSIWFFVVDVISGRPFFTPMTLGHLLFGVDGESQSVSLLLVFAYTVFHYAAFAAVALGAVLFIQLAEREPALFVLFLLLFTVLEIGFHGMVAILHEARVLDGFEWYQIAIGNLLASLVMGRHLWYAHPSFRFGVQHAMSQ